MKKTALNQQINSLVIFRELLNDKVFANFQTMLKTKINDANLIDAIADFESSLFETTTNWSEYLLKLVLESDNIYIRRILSKTQNEVLEDCMKKELSFFENIACLSLIDFLNCGYETSEFEKFKFLPQWETSSFNFVDLYLERISKINQKGFGMFASHHVFTIEKSKLIPVKYPDNQKLSELPGYELERNEIIKNTKALLANCPANNVLLYGDAGTGKSSCVKAIANEFAKDGLRLIEVKKNQLYHIPDIIESLHQNPLKFILFIDDLSFATNDDNFASLKAILEGSVCGQSKNLVVYATSNRRHLIKESWSDRDGDDIHASDTRQELMSLSERFGLTVTFQKPEKKKYESIVLALAKQYNIDEDEDEIITKAEQFATQTGGRSPRTAKHFIQMYKSGVK